MKEKVLRNTQIRNIHNVGEIERAQELRADEVSVQKLGENHETIQQHTSQLQQMQEQMSSMNDSGYFQDVESNKSGTLSHVSRMIPVLVLCSAATKNCRLTHGINLDYRMTFLEINFQRLIHPQFILKESNLTTCKETEEQPLKQKGRRLVTQVKTDKIKAQFQCRHFAPRPLTTSSTTPVELPKNYMVGQQRQQISELQLDKFPNPQSFLVWKIRFKNQVTTCSDFPLNAMLWIKEVEMVDSLDELKSSRSVCGMIFQTSRCCTRRLLLL